MKQLSRPFLGALLAFAILVLPGSSEAATHLRLNLGADYQVNHGALFGVSGAVDFGLVGPLSIGPRVGLLLATAPNAIGLPLDLDLRLTPRSAPVYVELLVGPWLFFGGDAVRAHAALGFGYQGRSFGIGLEVGYLEPAPHVGLRVGWRF